MSAGLQTPESDIDVLCIGGSPYKLKSPLVDLIIEPSGVTTSEPWLQSELAAHVAQYGTWIKGTPIWKRHARVGNATVDSKLRRVSAFMESLQRSWLRLEECFRFKYSVKLRRETQRLILLERGAAIPPTRILDEAWSTVTGPSAIVCSRLTQFVRDADGRFLEDLLSRVRAQTQASGLSSI